MLITAVAYDVKGLRSKQTANGEKMVSIGSGGTTTPVSGVSISGCPSGNLSARQSVTLNANVQPSDATNKGVSWSSNNTSVASVNSSGVVTANASGSATITVTTNDGGYTATCIITVEAQQTGTENVNYEYFHGSWNTLPDFDALSPVATGQCVNFDISNRTVNDDFAFRFTSNIEITSSGTYTFYTNSDDGSKLFINGTEVVNNDGTHAPKELSGSINLNSGSHEIVVTFFEKGGGEVLDVSYEGPGITKQLIPNSVLSLTSSSVPVTGISINNCPSYSLDVGGTYDLNANISPSGASNTDKSWISSNTSVATVNNSGVVTALSAGNVTITVTSSDGGYTDNCILTIESVPTGVLAAEVGLVSNVQGSWKTVALSKSYSNPVVICTPVLNTYNDVPAVARVRNAGSTSFEVRLVNPGGSAVTSSDVHYLVVEEGVYSDFEAIRMTSTKTASKSNWGQYEALNTSNSYSSPVVLGQVMTTNDGWSNFWACGSSVGNAPAPGNINVGKMVAEDTDNTRNNETLGILVIEAGSGTIDGIPYHVALGADVVDGASAGYTYPHGLSNASIAILSAAGMDGGDGGWPVLFGPDPVSSSGVTLSFDEDQISDSDRNHTTEEVAYMVFEQEVQPVGCDGTGSILYQRFENLSGTSISQLTSAATYPDGPDYSEELASFEAPTNIMDQYGVRVVGYICPPESGTYYFWIAADDNTELWLSTNNDPANKVNIAGHTSWTSSREWNKFASQKSAAISLNAGQLYFVEALMKEHGGGDNLAVGWRKPSDGNGTDPVEIVPGSALKPYVPSGTDGSGGTGGATGPSGLVHQYLLNNNTDDAIGNQPLIWANGTANYTASAQEGSAAASLDENGENQKLTAGNMSLGNTFTLSCWAYNPGTQIHQNWLFVNNVNNIGFATYINSYNSTDGKICFDSRDANGANYNKSAAVAFVFNQWNLVTYTVDVNAGTVNMYCNGALVGTGNLKPGATYNQELAIGGGTGGSNWNNYNGYLDDIRVYDRVLTESEVSDLYNSSKKAYHLVNDLTDGKSVFEVYPNPVSNVLNINTNISNGIISLVDLMGRTVYTSPVNEQGHVKIDVHSFEQGIYILNISNGTGNETRRIIIQ